MRFWSLVVALVVLFIFVLSFVSSTIKNYAPQEIVFSVLRMSCLDEDGDKICDVYDYCPKTPHGLRVDDLGCSLAQFCENQPRCGSGCDLADWRNDSKEKNPRDCTTVIVSREGRYYPQCSPLDCKGAITLPSSGVGFTVKYAQDSFFETILSGIPSGYHISNGSYLGWCVDLFHQIHLGHLYNATLYLSIDPNLTSKCPNCASGNWSYVNYILNHKQGSMMDVQNAIRYYIGGGLYPTSIDSIAMVEEAKLYGANFKPGRGDVLAVIADLGSKTQLTIFEVDP